MPVRILRSRRSGLIVTLAALAIVEAARAPALALPDIVRVMLLTASVAAVAFSAFVGGARAGLAAAGLVGAYAVRWASPPGSFVVLSRETLQAGAVMLIIATTISLVVSGLKRHADRVAAAALEAERRHAEELRRANVELRRANEALQAFSYLVSHDLKEPVRTTETLLAFLEEDHGASLPPDARDLLARSRRANERLSRLLASLLDLSRASRIDPAEIVAVDVARVIGDESCGSRYQDLARERGARLDLDVADGPAVLATPASAAQVFGNLVANAIAHNPAPAPRVVVRRAPGSRPGMAAFVVEDDGKGFPPGLVERFHQKDPLPSSTRDGGFGLIIARRAVERLGGSMSLGRSDLGGAAVRVELPLAPQGDAPTSPPAASR